MALIVLKGHRLVEHVDWRIGAFITVLPSLSLLGCSSARLSMNWVLSGWICTPRVSRRCSRSAATLWSLGKLVAHK